MRRVLLGSVILLGSILSACNAESEEVSGPSHNEEDLETAEDQRNEIKTEQETTNMLNVTSEEKSRLDNKYSGMENDGFIVSIDVQNEAYSLIMVTIDGNNDKMKSEAFESRVKGIGESIRESTAGIAHEGEHNTLPIIVFKDMNNNVIAEYTSRERNAPIIFH
jgi:hypothetical protein